MGPTMKDLLGPSQDSYQRLSRGDVINRLEMGDDEPRANRVLHVAYQGQTLTPGTIVGCMSSTIQPPWTESGCGHWGLVVVDTASQGKGIASILISEAEARLARTCHEIQIEYEFTPEHAYSERLKAWYEGSCGFTCRNDYGSRGRSTQFRKCRKKISSEARGEIRIAWLTEMKRTIVSQLDTLPGVRSL